MAYKKIYSFISYDGAKNIYIYLYNDNNRVDDLNGRPCFVHYRNGVIIDEQYYKNGRINLDINKPHHIMYYDNGNIKRLHKSAVGNSSFGGGGVSKHLDILHVYFDENGSITEQRYLNRQDKTQKIVHFQVK